MDMWNKRLERDNINDFYNETIDMVYPSVYSICKETTRTEQAIVKSYVDVFQQRQNISGEEVMFVFGDILLKNANDIVEKYELPENLTFGERSLDEYTRNSMLDKILARIDRIKELKNELTVEQMQELFSANVKSFKIPLKDFKDLEIVSKLSITAFCANYPGKELLDFNDVFGMYVVDHLMKLNGFYLEDAKQVLRLLCKYLSVEASKDYQLLLLRKMGVPMTVLVHGEEEILLEDNTEIIACANLVEFEEALKDRLIA